MSTVGKRLRKLRKEKGLTQSEVTGSEYSKEYVSQVELGKTKPSRKAVKLFAKYLDVDETYFETGVDLAGRERFENLVAKGEASIERREYGEAVRAFEEARTIAEKAENQDLVWRAEVGRGWALHFSGKVREALSVLTQARSFYEEKYPDGLELATVLFRMGCGRDALGDSKLAILLLEEALKILDRGAFPGDALRMRVLRRMAAIHTKRNDLEAAGEAAEAALDLARRLEDKRAIAEAYWEASVLEERRREFLKAANYALQARDIMRELGDQQDTAKLLNNLGDIKNQMSEYGEAGRYFEEGLSILRSVDDPETRSYLLNGLATSLLGEGQTQKALDLSSKSLAIMEGREGNRTLVGSSHMVRAKAHLASGMLEEARAELEEAKEIFSSLDVPYFLSAAFLLEGDILSREGRTEEAGKAYRKSSDLLQVVGW